MNFGSLEKMNITYLEPKDYLGRSGEGLITSLGLRNILRSNKNKKTRYAINNVSMKYISKINKEFEKFLYKGYVQKRTKHEPTDSYFYLSRHIDKCMMRADVLNSENDPVGTDMTGTKQIPTSHVCFRLA